MKLGKELKGEEGEEVFGTELDEFIASALIGGTIASLGSTLFIKVLESIATNIAQLENSEMSEKQLKAELDEKKIKEFKKEVL